MKTQGIALTLVVATLIPFSPPKAHAGAVRFMRVLASSKDARKHFRANLKGIWKPAATSLVAGAASVGTGLAMLAQLHSTSNAPMAVQSAAALGGMAVVLGGGIVGYIKHVKMLDHLQAAATSTKQHALAGKFGPKAQKHAETLRRAEQRKNARALEETPTTKFGGALRMMTGQE